MKNLWLMPLIVLVLLLAAPSFRWEYTATKTQEGPKGAVIKWKTDTWSGAMVKETYNPGREGDYRLEVVRYTDKFIGTATTIWGVITGLMGCLVVYLWLFPIIKSRKNETLKE